MQSLFEPEARAAITQRLASLSPGAARQWGKMTAAQMLAHCSNALETGTGDRPLKQKLIGKILGPFVRGSLLGDKPFPKDSPTDPSFIVRDDRDFASEKARLTALVRRFADAGPAAAQKHAHAFLGRLSGEEWGVMMFKHVDHHLRQFGA